MSSSEENLVADVRTRKSAKRLSAKQTARVRFDDFAELPHAVGDFTDSPTFSCHGREWNVAICPGGLDEEVAGNVSLSLHLTGEDRNVKAKFTLRIPAANKSATRAYDFKGSALDDGYGCRNICTREEALNSLNEDGALVVYADIQIYTNVAPKYKPKKSPHLDMTTLLESTNFTDVTFSVGEQTFPAHRNILSVRAPALAALAEEVSPESVIELENIEASIFELSLRSIYSVEAPGDIKDHAIDYLAFADLYGCVYLKLLAESELETSLCVNNAADLLLLGDAKNCALLKESALLFIARHHSEVMDTPEWSNLSESASLLNEIMTTMAKQARANSSANEDDESSDFSNMRVCQLRNLLEEQGLGVDGSKEMLVKRLQEAQLAEGSDKARPRKRRRTV